MRRHGPRAPGWGYLLRVLGEAGATGGTDRPLGGDGDHVAARDLFDGDPAGAAERAGDGGRGCGDLVSPDVAHCETRGDGVAQMKTRSAECGVRSGMVGIVLAGLAFGTSDLLAQTSLSIYSDGRVVVRKTLPQALQKGRNQLTVQI